VCGRFTASDPQRISLEFQLPFPAGLPRFNVAPTQEVPAILNRLPKEISFVRFGFSPASGKVLVNARSETVTERPAFREAVRKRRCLVLADGFFEWKRSGKHSVPYYIRQRDHRPFSFAGLWNPGKDAPSTTILTGPANALVAPIHDRMPIIIEPEDRDRWLVPEAIDPAAFADLFVPTDPKNWVVYPVSSLVNSVQNDQPECIEPGETQPSLF
jgi:putative SOS response-associated peptidase YedK